MMGTVLIVFVKMKVSGWFSKNLLHFGVNPRPSEELSPV